MFDLGFTELLLVAVVALVVLGPERLPKAARFAGLWVRRARAQWDSVKGELERELAAEELKRSLQESREAMQDLGTGVRAAGEQARTEMTALRDDTVDALRPADDDTDQSQRATPGPDDADADPGKDQPDATPRREHPEP
jgi:sec-independent protein translocase protein TatB